MRASKPRFSGGGRSRAPALHRRLHDGLRAGVLILGLPLIVAACGGDDDDANAGNPPPPVAMSCAGMVGMALPDATITAATEVAAGPFVPTGTASYTVPAFCRLQGRSTPTSDSLINFEVWVPKATAWNGKVVVTGNGGYSPALSYGDMVAALGRGYATVGGDTGHQSADPNDLKFGIGHPEKIRDWGTRSIHAITQAAKPAITAVQGKSIARSYYQGCSTGGHQGYAEVQRYPGDFDGVIAGAPGNNRTALNAGFMWQFLANHAQNDNTTPILTSAKIQLVTRQAVAACDARDGVADGVISDPRRCTPDVFNVASLQCTGADNADCLTAPQVGAMQKMYAGARNLRTGEQVYPGWPVGSESGWASYWGTTEPTRADYWRYWVFNDPNWNWWTFDFDQGMATARTTVGPLVDQISTDVSAFKARGGKLLVYNGWADPVVNPIDTIAYFDRLAQAQGSPAQVASFARLFLVPGMGHCGGGTGTSTVDWLTALDTWVESGVAPDALPASRVANQVVNRTRPICAYPKEAKYSGTGSIDDAANFTCG